MFKTTTKRVKNLSSCLFLGGDIHKNNHTFVALDGLYQKMGLCVSSDALEDLDKLRSWIEKLKEPNRQVIIGLEDSRGNGERVSRFLVKYGYSLFNVNPCFTAQRRKRTVHQDKSDQGDALLVAKTLISELDNLPEIKVTQQIETAKMLKEIMSDYDSLVKNQTQLKNQLHRLLYQKYGDKYKKSFKGSFSQKALDYWLKDSILKKNERDYGGLTPEYSEATVEPSQLKHIRNLRVKQKVEYLLFLQKEIKHALKTIKDVFSWLPYQNLLSLSGCGIIVASKIVGEIKDIGRFQSASQLAKYAGLAPQERSSGRTKKHRTSKFGNRQLNKAFYRIALSQIGSCSNPKAVEYYLKKIKEGKSKKRALKSLTRRNVDIVYAMMRDGTDYKLEK